MLLHLLSPFSLLKRDTWQKWPCHNSRQRPYLRLWKMKLRVQPVLLESLILTSHCNALQLRTLVFVQVGMASPWRLGTCLLKWNNKVKATLSLATDLVEMVFVWCPLEQFFKLMSDSIGVVLWRRWSSSWSFAAAETLEGCCSLRLT
jgi:hypothetical protein